MRHSITLFTLTALAVMAPRRAVSQHPGTPNAVVPHSSDAIDDTTRAVTGRASEVFVRTDAGWQNPFWYLGPR
jgi:hypothetical protein